MNRSHVRAWLHQAALDVARLAEPRLTDRPCGEPPLACSGHESFHEAEREARGLAVWTEIAYVVVEARHADDPPGVEAIFVVCPADAAGRVTQGREVVFRSNGATRSPEATSQGLLDATRLTNRALQSARQGQDPEMWGLLWEIHCALRVAQGLPTVSWDFDGAA